MTNLADAIMCEDEGVDAVGFVLISGRTRSISATEARRIGECLGPMTTRTVIVPGDDINAACDAARDSDADVIQIQTYQLDHIDLLKEHGHRVTSVVLVDINTGETGLDCDQLRQLHDSCSCIIFEPSVDGRFGGLGISFDYARLLSRHTSCCTRFGVAGGLRPDNLHRALVLRPYIVDVSSGVESAIGQKSRRLVHEFVDRCRNSRYRGGAED